MHYVAFAHTDDSPGFGVNSLDAPGCATQGDRIDDALRLNRKALAFHVAGMSEDGEAIPETRDTHRIEADPSLDEWREGATLAYVPPISDMDSSKRVNVSIDLGLWQLLTMRLSLVV